MDRYCPTFNHSTMVFLPKTPVPGSPSDSPVFYPSAVRPLNISNADNRILASAVRIAVEPRLGPLITNRQRGFIQGRSMIANLLDVEEGMYTAAATGSGGLSFFFDFEAAFPSVEHDSLHGYFAYLGWPPWLLQFMPLPGKPLSNFYRRLFACRFPRHSARLSIEPLAVCRSFGPLPPPLS